MSGTPPSLGGDRFDREIGPLGCQRGDTMPSRRPLHYLPRRTPPGTRDKRASAAWACERSMDALDVHRQCRQSALAAFSQNVLITARNVDLKIRMIRLAYRSLPFLVERCALPSLSCLVSRSLASLISRLCIACDIQPVARCLPLAGAQQRSFLDQIGEVACYGRGRSAGDRCVVAGA